jgi:hypothetical protein
VSDDPMDQGDRPPHPLDYISEDAIQDLWGIGYTIVKRTTGDPFEVPQQMVPQTRKYQWWHLVHDKFHFFRPENCTPSGWAPVPASRHDGYFMPFGHKGDIEVGGLGLFEKSKLEVDQELAANTVAAHKQVADWVDKTGAEFSGSVNIGGAEMAVGEQNRDVYATSKTKTLETTVKIPKDMVPYMAQIFAERDRLKGEILLPDRNLKPGVIADKFYTAIDHNPEAPWWPTLHAILLPIAIENVRKQLTEETKP